MILYMIYAFDEMKLFIIVLFSLFHIAFSLLQKRLVPTFKIDQIGDYDAQYNWLVQRYQTKPGYLSHDFIVFTPYTTDGIRAPMGYTADGKLIGQFYSAELLQGGVIKGTMVIQMSAMNSLSTKIIPVGQPKRYLGSVRNVIFNKVIPTNVGEFADGSTYFLPGKNPIVGGVNCKDYASTLMNAI